MREGDKKKKERAGKGGYALTYVHVRVGLHAELLIPYKLRAEIPGSWGE